MAQPALAKSLPHSPDAERAILGAILRNNEALAAAAEALTPNDFFHPIGSTSPNKTIFAAMLAMRQAGQAIDELTLIDRLESIRELEAAGGAAYIASLGDGVPSVSNIAHYAAIVREKAHLREIIRATESIGARAIDGFSKAEELYSDLDTFMRISSNGHNGHRKLHPATIGEISLMNLKPTEYVIAPILPVQGLGMLYSPRGKGKTFVSLEIAYSVAVGLERCFQWTIPAARPVLYVDGEMPANRMQDRIRGIVQGHGMRYPSEQKMFRIITPDLEHKGVSPNISSSEGQRMIEDHLAGDELLVLDNLSCLTGGKENEGEDWMPVAEWALRLRRRGVSVLFIHHAGKGGDQRGTSRREDLLDCVIAMRTPSETTAADGLLSEIHLEKLRNEGSVESAFPFELKMTRDGDGAVYFTHRPLANVIEQKAIAMFRDGMSIRDVAEDLHITKHRAHKIKNQMEMSGQ